MHGLQATAYRTFDVAPLIVHKHGLPVGAQIIGDSIADPLCLQMAQWLETAWCGFQPPPSFA